MFWYFWYPHFGVFRGYRGQTDPILGSIWTSSHPPEPPNDHQIPIPDGSIGSEVHMTWHNPSKKGYRSGQKPYIRNWPSYVGCQITKIPHFWAKILVFKANMTLAETPFFPKCLPGPLIPPKSGGIYIHIRGRELVYSPHFRLFAHFWGTHFISKSPSNRPKWAKK